MPNENIKKLLKQYYRNEIFYLLSYLGIFDKIKLKEYINLYFENCKQIISLKTKFKNFIIEGLINYKGDIKNKYYNFLSKVNNKYDFIDIFSVSKQTEKDFLIKIFYKYIYYYLLNIIEEYNNYLYFFNDFITININNLSNYQTSIELKKYINSNMIESYKNIIRYYLDFFNKLSLNKYYIYPLIDKNGDIYNSLINLDDNKAGSILFDDDEDDEMNNLKFIKIKNKYNKSDIKKAETILKNTKINDLIKENKIKLNPKYEEITYSILDKQNQDNKSERETKQKELFEQLFIYPDDQNKSNYELTESFVKEPNKKQFMDYLIDKISYTNQNKNDMTQNINAIDKIINNILNNDFSHNSLNLTNHDMKTILMLETLNSIKNFCKDKTNKNLTVNVFNKDLKSFSVNEDSVKLY